MNRAQFFGRFGKYCTPGEIKYFDYCWKTFEQHQKTNHKTDFPYSKDAPQEVKFLWKEMWDEALHIYVTRYDKKGGK